MTSEREAAMMRLVKAIDDARRQQANGFDVLASAAWDEVCSAHEYFNASALDSAPVAAEQPARESAESVVGRILDAGISGRWTVAEKAAIITADRAASDARVAELEKTINEQRAYIVNGQKVRDVLGIPASAGTEPIVDAIQGWKDRAKSQDATIATQAAEIAELRANLSNADNSVRALNAKLAAAGKGKIDPELLDTVRCVAPQFHNFGMGDIAITDAAKDIVTFARALHAALRDGAGREGA